MRAPLKKPIAAFADSSSDDDDDDDTQNAHGVTNPMASRRKKLPLFQATSDSDEDKKDKEEEEENGEDRDRSPREERREQPPHEPPADHEEPLEEEDDRGRLRYRKGGGMRGFVPAGFDKEKAKRDREEAMEKRAREMELARDRQWKLAAQHEGRQHEGDEPEKDKDDDTDELDAYMLEMREEDEKRSAAAVSATNGTGTKAIRADIEDEDELDRRELAALEQIQRHNAAQAAMGKDPNASHQDIEDVEAEYAATSKDEPQYDSRGNLVVPPPRNKDIEALPPVDHSQVEYPAIEKCFYQEPEEISSLAQEQVDTMRGQWGMQVSGLMAERPCTTFAQWKLPRKLLESIRRHGFTEPTPIQAQAVPCALAGRDLLAIAKTGSGKTAAYLWPMLVHSMDQPALAPKDGPIGLVLAPTRELAHQIYVEAKSFATALKATFGATPVAEVVGGVSKGDQFKVLRNGLPVVVVATPGRLIDMIRMKATNLQRVSFVVLDEADRMLDLGFEKQVQSILQATRPDRQTLLFSATFRDRVEKLAEEYLTDPVRIHIGSSGMQVEGSSAISFNPLIEQRFQLLTSMVDKWPWILANLPQTLRDHPNSSVLIFVGKKEGAIELGSSLVAATRTPCLTLHGDMPQDERVRTIQRFKRQDARVLVATDIASRGLDIPHLQFVINYDLPRDIEGYIHRIGRTGRQGQQRKGVGGTAVGGGIVGGVSITMITEREAGFAGKLCQFLRHSSFAKKFITAELQSLADRAKLRRQDRAMERGIAAPTALYQTEAEKDAVKRAELAAAVPAVMKSGWQHQLNPNVSMVPVWKQQPADDGRAAAPNQGTSNPVTTTTATATTSAHATSHATTPTATSAEEPKRKKSRWDVQ